MLRDEFFLTSLQKFFLFSAAEMALGYLHIKTLKIWKVNEWCNHIQLNDTKVNGI